MFTSHHHHAPTSPPAGPAAPIIASAHAGAPGPVSPTSRSARLRTFSVIRSVAHRVTTATTSQSSSPSSSSASASASAPASASASASHDSAGPTPPSPGHHSPRSIWPHSPIRRSLSYTPAVASQTSAAPGARESVSEEGIARSKSHVPTGSTSVGSAAAAGAESSSHGYTQAHGHAHGHAHGNGHRHGAATALDIPSEPLAATTQAPSESDDSVQLQLQSQPQSHPSPSPSSSPELPAESATMSPPGVLASGAPAPHAQNPAATLPSIRFTAYVDPRAQRPSLTFSHTTRILPSGSEVIRVGRYSERDGHGTAASIGSDRMPNSSPVGFKSKVVSRRHCEFWFENAKWYVKDVKSSSGTFLNHIRLSPPGTESKPYVVNDGDIVQLGIDFKGGEEMIFRCVKIRLELNRGWASRPSNFNLASHKRLRSLVSQGSSNSQDCSICLNSIAPCQSLFVAPCSHTWHYKCIRSLLNTPQYPYFQCPNCRASADLEAEVEEPDEEWERLSDVQEASADADSEGKAKETESPPMGPGMGVGTTGTVISQLDDADSGHSDPLSPSPPTSTDASARTSSQMLTDPDTASSSRARPSSTSSSTDKPPDNPSGNPSNNPPAEWSRRTAPVPIAPSNAGVASSPSTPSAMGFHRSGQRTPSPNNNRAVHGADGPITPRNDAGPWVFDGLAGRGVAARGDPLFADGRAAEANSGSIDDIMDTDDD